jgi:hypothetical protein
MYENIVEDIEYAIRNLFPESYVDEFEIIDDKKIQITVYI